jgi:hypothetical protein
MIIGNAFSNCNGSSDFSSWEAVSPIKVIIWIPPSWCTLKFTACFGVSHSTAHARSQAANFTDNNFANRELSVKALRKAKSVKTTVSNTSFVHITKPNQDFSPSHLKY